MRAPKSIISEQTRLQYRVFALLADEIPLKAVANIWPALVQDIERPQNPPRLLARPVCHPAGKV